MEIKVSEHAAHRRFAAMLLEVQKGTTFSIMIDGEIVAELHAHSADPDEREEARYLLVDSPEIGPATIDL